MLMAALLIFAALAIGVAIPPAAQANADPAFTTFSYYVNSSDPADLRHLGRETADQGRKGAMSLFFGSPTTVSGTFGATLFGATDQTTGQIRELAKAFIEGYFNNSTSSQYMRVGIGTSNCTLGGVTIGAMCSTSASYKTDAWAGDHGDAWDQMVSNVSSWIADNHYGARVGAWAAWDMEPAWSDGSRSRSWMDHYDGNSSPPLIANFSADGCPQTAPDPPSDNRTCDTGVTGGYSQNTLWHLAWEHTVSFPFPQIYYLSMAKEWKWISEYGYHAKQSPIVFFGAMSEHARDSSTDTVNESHDQLLDQIQSHTHTNVQTDITYTTNLAPTLHDH
jgi:hypothetical protein